MKRTLFLTCCLIISGINVFAQQVINANDASEHIGEQVVVSGTVYDVKAYNDSTAVIDLGKSPEASVSVILSFNSKFKFDDSLLKKLRNAKIEATGFMVLLDGQPAIILTEEKKLNFLPNGTARKWLTFAAAFRDQVLLRQ